MAFTNSLIVQTVFGDKRVVFHQVTPDAAEGTLVTGLINVDFAVVSPKKQASFIASGNTSQTSVNYLLNVGSTSTVALGTIGFSGCVANNVYAVISFGK
jgi:hypothetical protein